MSLHDCNMSGSFDLQPGTMEETIKSAFQEIIEQDFLEAFNEGDIEFDGQHLRFNCPISLQCGLGYGSEKLSKFLKAMDAITGASGGVIELLDYDSGDSELMKIFRFVGPSEEAKNAAKIEHAFLEFEEAAGALVSKETLTRMKRLVTPGQAGAVRKVAYGTTTPEDAPRTDPEFEVSADDQLHSNGQMNIDTAPLGGHIDDVLGVICEIAENPVTKDSVQVVRIARGEEVILNVFADGVDRVLLEAGAADFHNRVAWC